MNLTEIMEIATKENKLELLKGVIHRVDLTYDQDPLGIHKDYLQEVWDSYQLIRYDDIIRTPENMYQMGLDL